MILPLQKFFKKRAKCLISLTTKVRNEPNSQFGRTRDSRLTHRNSDTPSMIGAVNPAQVTGISVHMGAALAIARRGLGLSEKPPKREAIAPSRNGGHVTFCAPARMRQKHVWSHWGKIRTTLKAAHVAHGRSGEPKGKPAPLTPARQSLGANRPFTAKSREANRQQHCSAGVLGDVPL